MKMTFEQRHNLGRSVESGNWFNPSEATKEPTDDERADMRAKVALIEIFENAEIINSFPAVDESPRAI